MVLAPDVSGLIEELRQELAALRAENAALKQEVAELRRRLGKDSSNSNKPPSSDGLAKKPRIAGSLRGISGKQSGGQRGHQGDTLRPVAKPDKIERHEATQCGHCRAALTAAMATRVEKRQVFEMPQPRLEVTEHQASIYTCACCHSVTRAAFPAEVRAHVQYGPRIRAAAVYLNAQHLIPEDRVGEIMHDLFGAPLLCPASIAAWGFGEVSRARHWASIECRRAAAGGGANTGISKSKRRARSEAPLGLANYRYKMGGLGGQKNQRGTLRLPLASSSTLFRGETDIRFPGAADAV